MSFRVEQMDHVELQVPDRYAAAKWYRHVFGLTIVADLEHWALDPHSPLMIATPSGDTKLALFQGDATGSQFGIGFHLVAFRTSGLGFLEFLERLPQLQLIDSKGRAVGRELARDHRSAYSIYFCDPYGNQFEITTYDHDLVRKQLRLYEGLTIRDELVQDSVAIEELIRIAFSASQHGHHGEAELPSLVKEAGVAALSLVAIIDERVVGHILFTEATLRIGQREIKGMGLAPLAVHPDFQYQGIGTALIRDGLSKLWTQTCDFVIVLGAPNYYSRCGFRLAKENGISHGFAGMPQGFFLIQFRPDFDTSTAQGGLAFYTDLFGPQHLEAL